MTPAEKLRAATGYLIFHHPFIATPLLRLKLVPTRALSTAAVDGRSIFYNEDFVSGLTAEQTIFLLAHEVLHVALAPHLRRGDRNLKGWNAAADFVINLMLKAAGFTLAPGALLDPAYAAGRPSGFTGHFLQPLSKPAPRPWPLPPVPALPPLATRQARRRPSRTSSPKAPAARS